MFEHKAETLGAGRNHGGLYPATVGGEDFQRLRPAALMPGDVAVSRFHSAADEAVSIAQETRRLVDEEGVQWQDIAVLFRKNAQIPLLRDAFEAYDIPFEVAALGGLLSVPVVADLRAWLEILDDPSHAPSLSVLSLR